MNKSIDLSHYTKLNIACGPVSPFPEPWLNIDIKSEVAQLELDVKKLPEEWTGHFWEVRASHVVEHLYTSEWAEALGEWLRVLKPGGVLRIALPDLKIIVENLFTSNGKDMKGRKALSLDEPTAVLTQIYGVGYESDDTEKRWRHRIAVDDSTVINFINNMGECEIIKRIEKHSDSAALHGINDDSQNSWSMTIASKKKGDSSTIIVKEQEEFKIESLTRVPIEPQVSAVFAIAFNEFGQLLVIRNTRGWDIPGGHVETGETPEVALHREVLEEGCATIENVQLYLSAVAQKRMLFYVATIKDLLPFETEYETDRREFMHPSEFISMYGGGKPELITQVITAALQYSKN